MRRRNLRSGLGTLASAALAVSSANADSALLLHPTDDALVVSDPTLVDHNYGNEPQILAWANYPSFGARSYVRFDLSAIPAGERVTFARLSFLQYDGGGYSSGIDIYRVADDGWAESTITWNNQPVIFPAAPDIISQDPTLTGGERRWISFDLLANGAWDPSVDAAPADGKLSLIVRTNAGEVGTQRAHNLCSSEGGPFDCLLPGEAGPVAGRAPQLVIGTPEPALPALLGAGIAALTWTGRSRTPSRRASRRDATRGRPASGAGREGEDG